MMLKAIFFDAAGTLIYLPRSVGEHYAEIVAEFGVTIPAAAMDDAFRQVWKEMPDRPPTPDGGPRPDDDKGWWHELVSRVLARTLPASGGVMTTATAARFDADACFERLYARFAEPGVWAAFPEVRETLDALRTRGLRLAVVSNFDRRLRDNLADLGLAADFEAILLSSEVGADKPDPRVFRRALEALNITAAEAVHVGDDPVKDGGAEAVGVRVFHLDRPRNSLRDLLGFLDQGDA